MRTQINNTLLLAAMVTGCFANNLFSQTNDSPIDMKKSRFGFKGSMNFSWVHLMEGRMERNGVPLGYSYGIMADFNLGSNSAYWLGTELIVTSIPGKIASLDTLYNSHITGTPAAFTNAQFDYKLQYVQVPITLKLKTNEIGKFIYWGQFGLAPALMIQNKVSTVTTEQLYKSGTSSHSPNSESNDVFDFDGSGSSGAFEDNVVPLRISMVLGAGVEFNISGKTSCSLGLRFDNGFTDLFWDKAVKGRNNYLALNAGIFF